MKNRKTAKLLIMVLSLALLIGSAVGIAASAENAAPEIISQNVEYSGTLNFKFAISAENLGADKTVTVNIYDKNPEEDGAVLLDTTTAAYEDVSGTNLGVQYAYVATSKAAISALDYGTEYYAQAVCDDAKSEVVKYSAVEYFLTRLYREGETVTDIQREHYENVLAYGSTTQKVTGDTGTNVADFVFVAAEDGKVNGKDSVVVEKGTEVTLTYTGENSGFVGYVDANGKRLSSTAAVSASGTYEAKFADVSFNDETLGGKISNVTSGGDAFAFENRVEGNTSDKVAVFTNTKYNDLRFTTTKADEANANCYVFEADINFSGVLSNGGLQFSYGVGGKDQFAYFRIWIDGTTVKMIDYHYNDNRFTTGAVDDGAKSTVLGTAGEWFNFRVEYYIAQNREDARIKYYVNDVLVLCTNNYPASNIIYDDGDDTTTDTYYAPPQTLDRAFRITTSSSCTATFKIDNYSFAKVVKECADDALTYETQDP